MVETQMVNLGSRAEELVPCSMCQKDIPPGEFFTFRDAQGNDVYLCKECQLKASSQVIAENADPKTTRAVIFGIVAAVLAAVAWAALTVISGWEIGYAAIGVAYLVAWAIYLGSGRKKTAKLQMVSVFMAFVSMMLGKMLSVLYFANEYLAESGDGGVDYSQLSNWWIALESSVVDNGPIGWLIIGIGLYGAFQYSKPPHMSVE